MLTYEQLKLRKSGIGGSEVAAILGLSEYRDIVDVYKDKTSEEIVEKEESQKMHWGNVLEEPIAREFENQTGHKALITADLYYHKYNHEPAAEDLILRHPVYPWAIGNIDRFYETGDGQRGILEIKTTSKYYMSGWKYDVPMEYYCQVQHYMFIAKALGLIQIDVALIAILASGQDFTIVPVPLDEKYLMNAVPKLHSFWGDNVLAKVPPEPNTGEEVEKLYTAVADKQVEATKEVAELMKKLAQNQAILKLLETEADRLKDAVKLIMLDAELLTFEGDLLATWKGQTQDRFDEKSFKADYPELAREYRKTITMRKFLCKLKEKTNE